MSSWLPGWEDDDLDSSDDDMVGITAALHAMEYRRTSAIQQQETREQELADYGVTVSRDIDRQTMALLKEVNPAPNAAKEPALRARIMKTMPNLGLVSSLRRKQKQEQVREELIRTQEAEVKSKWARILEANRLQQGMMLTMRDRAQLGPLFCVELAYDLVRRACAQAEHKIHLVTRTAARWRGVLCRSAYRHSTARPFSHTVYVIGVRGILLINDIRYCML